VTGAAVGAALALAGALLQTAARNPLADSTLLGLTAGAGTAALVAILFFPALAGALPAFAFAGALAASLATLGFAGAGALQLDPLRMILAGVAIQALGFAGIALLSFLYAERAPAFVAFTVGSLNGRGWNEAAIATGTALAGGAIAFAFARPLDVLLLDDGSAAAVGLPVRAARLATAALAALLAGGAVSVAGLVGFVGLVVPNAVRLAVGPGHRWLVPLSALGGATLVLLADSVARSLAAPLELPVGALLAALGAPYLLHRVRRELA
jgi:iron complex transport system permease protein